VNELRNDVSAKFASRESHAGLEDKAIDDLSTGVESELFNNNGETKTGKYSEQVKRIIGVRVQKQFSDGVYVGNVIHHIPDLDDDVTEDTERWIIEYESGKQEAVDSEELAGIMSGGVDMNEEKKKTQNSDESANESKEEVPEDELGESKEEDEPESQPKPTPKPKSKTKTKPQDPLLNKRVQSIDKHPKTGKMEVSALGKIVKVHKKKGKSKQYEIEWDDDEYDNIKFGYGRIKKMLVSEN
jgi:hypothetical protein